MRTKRILSALILVGFFWIASGESVQAQRLYLNTGALFAEGADLRSGLDTEVNGTSPSIQGGLQVEYTDIMRLQAGVTYQTVFSFEGVLQLHPLTTDRKISPYGFVGFGRYFGPKKEDEQGVLPIGLGVAYRLDPSLNLNVELAARFTETQPRGEDLVFDNGRRFDDTSEIVASFMPTVGISYKIRRLRPEDRLRPGETPVEEEQRGGMSEEELRERRGGVRSPFEDPAGITAGGPPPEFEMPYTRDSLKTAGSPLVIRRGEPSPYDDPGAPPITGEIVPTQDGDMVRLPDGTFLMGLTDEDPFDLQNAGRRRITVSAFYIDRFEVTNAEYREYLSQVSSQEREEATPDSSAFVGSGSRVNFQTYFYGSTYDDYPVVAVAWSQARNYCQHYGYRLPTEAEWEYAARSGYIGGIYPWQGFAPTDAYGRYLANFSPDQGQAADGYAFTAPVDAFPSSRWGLHNISGNVSEWVLDAYSPSYSVLSASNPLYQDEGESRHVVRGGSWADEAFYIGVGVRSYQPETEASPTIGFRCAADVGQVEGASRRQAFQEANRPPAEQGMEGGQQPPQEGGMGQGEQPPQEGEGTAGEGQGGGGGR